MRKDSFDFIKVLIDTKENLKNETENMLRVVDANKAKIDFIEEEIRFFQENRLEVFQNVEEESIEEEAVVEIPEVEIQGVENE